MSQRFVATELSLPGADGEESLGTRRTVEHEGQLLMRSLLASTQPGPVYVCSKPSLGENIEENP